MNFAGLSSGDSLFLDANIFVYDFGPDPVFGPPCKALLNRIESGDLIGYISAPVFSDVARRLMTLEACQTFGRPYVGIGQRLRRRPTDIRKLLKSRQALDEILRIGVHVLPVNAQHVLLAGDLCRQNGILSGDGLIVAVMQSHGRHHPFQSRLKCQNKGCRNASKCNAPAAVKPIVRRTIPSAGVAPAERAAAPQASA